MLLFYNFACEEGTKPMYDISSTILVTDENSQVIWKMLNLPTFPI